MHCYNLFFYFLTTYYPFLITKPSFGSNHFCLSNVLFDLLYTRTNNKSVVNIRHICKSFICCWIFCFTIIQTGCFMHRYTRNWNTWFVSHNKLSHSICSQLFFSFPLPYKQLHESVLFSYSYLIEHFANITTSCNHITSEFQEQTMQISKYIWPQI